MNRSGPPLSEPLPLIIPRDSFEDSAGRQSEELILIFLVA
jgi:hypothetical protein